MKEIMNTNQKHQRNWMMKTNLSRLAAACLLTLVAPSLMATNLNSLDVAALPGDKVELKLSFDEPVEVPRGYTIEQPARIALDLPGVSNKLKNKNRELGAGNARSVTVVEAQDRTRMIINLSELTGYSVRSEGNSLFVVVGDGAVNEVKAPQQIIKQEPEARSVASIKNIDFQRGEQGEGNIVIDLAGLSTSPDIQEQNGQIRLFFPKTSLPDALRVRLDVKDFATPVNFINATERSGGASVIIEPAGIYDFLAYQTEDQLTVSVKPISKAEQERRNADRFAYTGEKLSLNFQDIDVRSVLQLIADFTDLNLVASDTVQGNITLRLQSVPWDQALDLVLKTKGLDQRKVGNVLLIAPAAEIAERERQELESQQQIAELAPLRRELIQVNYASASQIAALFQQVTSGQSDSTRGSITVDERTNSIIALQTQEQIDELRRIVVQLDIPVRQVMIEARIVEASVDFDKELGVRWGGAFGGDHWSAYGQRGNLGTGGGFGENCGPFGGGGCSLPVEGSGAPTPFVDLGSLNATSGIGIGFVSNRAILDLQLSAMEKTGHGEVVSQPKVVTSDKETAKILKGAEVPYQEASSSGATSTSFKEAALSLEVTPQITPDNRIIMEVKVTKDEPDFANALDGVPPIKKNEVTAKVLVSDGETIVIGGVFSNTQRKAVEKVPFLGDVPFIGRLFKRNLVQDQKNELLVFITPRILNDRAVSLNY